MEIATADTVLENFNISFSPFVVLIFGSYSELMLHKKIALLITLCQYVFKS
jgi:hypothetical protein